MFPAGITGPSSCYTMRVWHGGWQRQTTDQYMLQDTHQVPVAVQVKPLDGNHFLKVFAVATVHLQQPLLGCGRWPCTLVSQANSSWC